MEETSMAKANVRVMQYDSQTNSWVSSDSGLSRVQFFHNPKSDNYRVVGWDLSHKKVVLNCAVVRGMKYNRARDTFHQWRDSKQQVYGLNFTSADEADTFASAIEQALERMSVIYQRQQQPQPPPPPPSMGGPPPAQAAQRQNPAPSAPSTHMVTGEYVMPRTSSATSTRSDDITGHPHGMPNGPFMANGGSGNEPQYNNGDGRFQSSSDDSIKRYTRNAGSFLNDRRPGGLLRTTSVNQSSPEGRDSPRHNEDRSHPAVPPPPPVPASLLLSSGQNRLSRPAHRSLDVQSTEVNGDHQHSDEEEAPQSGLAAELRAARNLRARASSIADAEAAHRSSSTVGRAGGGGLDMMSDLQRALARRRAQQNGEGDTTDHASSSDDAASRFKSPAAPQDPPSSSSSIVPGFATLRKNSVPTLDNNAARQASAPTKASNAIPVSRADLEAFKREILTEFRTAMQQLKNEVIEALRATSNRS